MSEAKKIARALLNERLAACVNIVPKIESHYWWKGIIHSEPEVLLLIKTTRARLPALTRRIQALHSYDVPEVLVIPVIRGSVAYLRWIHASCGPACFSPLARNHFSQPARDINVSDLGCALSFIINFSSAVIKADSAHVARRQHTTHHGGNLMSVRQWQQDLREVMFHPQERGRRVSRLRPECHGQAWMRGAHLPQNLLFPQEWLAGFEIKKLRNDHLTHIAMNPIPQFLRGNRILFLDVPFHDQGDIQNDCVRNQRSRFSRIKRTELV